ncbi:g7164 [Coccomyxa elongata]
MKTSTPSVHPSSYAHGCADGVPSISSTATVDVHWNEVPAKAHSTADSPRATCAPSNVAALLTPAAGHLGDPIGAASLGAQMVWEHVADNLTMQRGLAGACYRGSMPSLSSTMCSLCVQVDAAPASGEVSIARGTDGLLCRSRARLSFRLYRALLGKGTVDVTFNGPTCLLVGDSLGRVWAHHLGSHSQSPGEEAEPSSLGAPPPPNAAATGNKASTGPVLLFDIQQPVLSIHPFTLPQSGNMGMSMSISRSHDCLLIVGRGGNAVQIWPKAEDISRPPSAHLQQPASATSAAASLAIRQMHLHAPVASTAVSQGILYYTAGGTAHAALLPSASALQPSASKSEAAAHVYPAKGESLHELQMLPLQCYGQCPQLLSVGEHCCSQSGAAETVWSDGKAASGSGAAMACRLIMLCTNGALFQGPLVSSEEILAVRPPLPSGKVQQDVKALIEGINELTACKDLLKPHLDAADAGLAELALSIPLAQGMRNGHNLCCRIEGALQAAAEGAAPDVQVTVSLQNTGPYPVTQAWSALIVCRAPQFGGGNGQGYHMQKAIPLRGLPVGRTWKHSFAVEEMMASFLEVSVYMCHTQPQATSEQDCAAALVKTVRIDMLHLMRPVPFQTPYERACIPEETRPQGTVTLSVLVTARSSMPNASQLLRQILTLGDESGLHPQGHRDVGSGALGLLNGSSITGDVSLGCCSANVSLHAALTTGPGTSVAQLELTLKSSDVAILAAARECLSWRLQEWQRMHPAVGAHSSCQAGESRKAALEQAQADLHELQRLVAALQEAEEGVRQLRQLADRGSGLHSQGLGFQALQQQSLSLRNGLMHAYLKLRSITAAALPYTVELQ